MLKLIKVFLALEERLDDMPEWLGALISVILMLTGAVLFMFGVGWF